MPHFRPKPLLKGPSCSERTMCKAEISNAYTPLVGTAVVKVSELQRVPITSYEVPKVP